MTPEQIEWIKAAQRLMRAAGKYSGWPEIADKGDKLFAAASASSARKHAHLWAATQIVGFGPGQICTRCGELRDAEGRAIEREPVAWVHTLDNTEGIESNAPAVVLSFSEKNPFGEPGIDYSETYPVTSKPLYE